MWIASKYGWFSIVKKAPSQWHIRARVKRDLENLKRAADLVEKIQRWPDADYRFRIIVTDSETMSAIFLVLVESIDYSNFKSMIAASQDQRDKLHAYHDIWGVMYRVQSEQ